MRLTVPVLLSIVVLLPATVAAGDVGSAKNPQAVQEVLAGKRTSANAAWWGFDEEDATQALQAAISSGAKTVIVPNLGKDWIVRPITLAGNQELVLEKGVVITAKRGEYRGGGDCVFSARDLSNLTIRGYGATVRMQKEDYIVGIVLKNLGWQRWFGQYVKAEWRTVLNLRGSTDISVFGLTLRDSGGDGIMVDDGSNSRRCRHVRLKDVVCDNNYRQGISVISVDGLVVENCIFKNTWGTPPSAGVDIEPDAPHQILKDLVFRNCAFEDNYGDGIEVFLAHQERKSDPISIRFEGCRVRSRRGPGIRVTKVLDNGPSGLIEFRNCVVENTEAYGIKVQDKSADSARLRFIDCTLRNVAKDRGYRDVWGPIGLSPRDANRTQRFGGIDFVNCRVEDSRDRPVITLTDDREIHDVTGTITVKNRHGVKTRLGSSQRAVTLSVKEMRD